MKAKTIIDAIGVIAACAAVAHQAYEVLAPHAERMELGNLVAGLPRRLSEGMSAIGELVTSSAAAVPGLARSVLPAAMLPAAAAPVQRKRAAAASRKAPTREHQAVSAKA
jgi:hypothetical protein